MRENNWDRIVKKFIADKFPKEEEKTICTCNIKENAELIARDSGVNVENPVEIISAKCSRNLLRE